AMIAGIKGDTGWRLPAGAKRACVIGGGNTAIDAAHELRLLGVEHVTMVYRRAETEMSGYAHEMSHARKDGVTLLPNRVAAEVARKPDGSVSALRVAPAKDGRR